MRLKYGIYQVEKDSEEWKYAWKMLEKDPINEFVVDDKTVADNPEWGETWQYMDSSKYNGKWCHCFRHRRHPIANKRIYLLVPVKDKLSLTMIREL